MAPVCPCKFVFIFQYQKYTYVIDNWLPQLIFHNIILSEIIVYFKIMNALRAQVLSCLHDIRQWKIVHLIVIDVFQGTKHQFLSAERKKYYTDRDNKMNPNYCITLNWPDFWRAIHRALKSDHFTICLTIL